MAKQETTCDDILKELRAKQYRPVYYLMGEESYYIDLISDYIVDNVLTDTEKEFNLTVVYGADVDIATVINAAKRYPMMSERQVVVVKEAQAIRNMEELSYYLQKPLNSTILVLCHKHGVLDRRKKLVAEIEKVGVLFESKKVKDAQLPAFITSYMKRKGVDLDPKATSMLADFVGTDLSRLTGELEKLIITLPKGQTRVTPEQIERNIGISKDYNNFELRSAIVEKDILKANKIIKYFEENPKTNPIQMTLSLYSHEENSLYRLEQLAGWGADANHELGVLPSVTDYLSTIDAANSYLYDFHTDAHKPFAIFSWQVVEDAKNDILFKSQWNFNFSHENMRYRRASLDKELSRNLSFLNPEFTLYWSGNRKNRKFSSSLVYSITQVAPQMLYLFDYIDDADPLNVKRYGNEKLKNSMLHHMQYVYNGSLKSLMYDLKYDYTSTTDAVAMGFIYDKNTGRRTFSPTNVNGNWNTSLRLGLSGNVDKKKRLMFNTVTSWGYVNSVDMISDTATEEMKKSIVKTSTISEDLRLDYKLGKHSLGVNAYVACLHSNGEQKDFETL